MDVEVVQVHVAHRRFAVIVRLDDDAGELRAGDLDHVELEARCSPTNGQTRKALTAERVVDEDAVAPLPVCILAIAMPREALVAGFRIRVVAPRKHPATSSPNRENVVLGIAANTHLTPSIGDDQRSIRVALRQASEQHGAVGPRRQVQSVEPRKVDLRERVDELGKMESRRRFTFRRRGGKREGLLRRGPQASRAGTLRFGRGAGALEGGIRPDGRCRAAFLLAGASESGRRQDQYETHGARYVLARAARKGGRRTHPARKRRGTTRSVEAGAA